MSPVPRSVVFFTPQGDAFAVAVPVDPDRRSAGAAAAIGGGGRAAVILAAPAVPRAPSARIYSDTLAPA